MKIELSLFAKACGMEFFSLQSLEAFKFCESIIGFSSLKSDSKT